MNRRSCLTNVLETFENWTKALDDGYGLDVIYWSILFGKEIEGMWHKWKVTGWIESFLIERRMRVGVRGVYSRVGKGH